VVSRTQISLTNETVNIPTDPKAWEDVFIAKPCIDMKDRPYFDGNQAGARLLYKDNMLFLSIGDFGFDGSYTKIKAPMDPNSNFGKIFEIDPRTKTATVYATGVRNPEGFAFSSDGLLWETEHGPQGGDEVNIIRKGENYGWPEVTYGMEYGFPRRNWK